MTHTVSATDMTRLLLNETDTVRSVLQNIAVILSTPKGSVPLCRNFGLDMSFLDLPMERAKIAMIAPVREAVEQWEPRASVTDVSFAVDTSNPGRLIPTVEVEIRDEQEYGV